MSTEYLSPGIIYFDPFSYHNLWYNTDESFNNLDILWCSIFLILVLIRLILYAFLQWNNSFFNISFSSITGFSLTVLSDIVSYEFTCNFNSFMDFFLTTKWMLIGNVSLNWRRQKSKSEEEKLVISSWPLNVL